MAHDPSSRASSRSDRCGILPPAGSTRQGASPRPAGICPPLPPPAGPVTRVSDVESLQAAVAGAAPGDVVLVEAGVYPTTERLNVHAEGVTVRGATGDPMDVVIDAGPNGVDEGLTIYADGVTVADLTIRNATYYAIHVQGWWDDGVDDVVIYNVRLLDAQDAQPLKVSTDWNGNMSHRGEVGCSYIGYTSEVPGEYANGLSLHAGVGWHIHDNVLRNVRGGGAQIGPAILVWSGSVDTVVERNVILDCRRGIAFGNPGAHSGFPDHVGGVIRNNFVVSTGHAESGIEVALAEGVRVLYNTVALLDGGGVQSIDVFGGGTTAEVAYNLTTSFIHGDRGGAATVLSGNVTDAAPSWFADPASGDLHLTAAAAAARSGDLLPDAPRDIDDQPRSAPTDVGADQR